MHRIDDEPAKVARVVSCLESGDIDGAKESVRNEPLILRSCPNTVTDSEEIVLAAMSRLLQAGIYASSRLKSDIEFLVRAFNVCNRRRPVNPSSARDLIFVLALAKYYEFYRHEISDERACEVFGVAGDAADRELDAARRLIAMCRDCRSWLTGNRERDTRTLQLRCEGFSIESYEYAFDWAAQSAGQAAAGAFR